MAVKFLSDVTIDGSATINLDSGDAFIINEPDKDQQGRLIFSYDSGDPTLTIASRGSTAKLHIRSDATNNGLYLDEDGSIYVNNSISDGVKINGTCLASIGTNAQKMDLGSATRPWGDIYSTGSYVNTLTLDSIAAASEETTSALFEESGTVVKANLGTNAFTSTTIPTNNNQLTNGAGYLDEDGVDEVAVMQTGNQSISGLKTFTDSTAGIKAKYKSSDGSTGTTSTFTVRNGNNSASLTFVVKDGIVTSVTSSDRRLKKEIKLIGQSPSGINIYEFKYRVKYAEKYGTGKFQGVMSDEVPWRAISIDKGGYDMVDYSMIDVEFKAIV